LHAEVGWFAPPRPLTEQPDRAEPLLLDEMLSDSIAQRLRDSGCDVTSVVADPALVAVPDDQILAHAAAEGRTLVTASRELI
jgi:predicted nuclease of predicted toxin-antitoxin system